MARTVEDAARIFNVVAGYDPADPYTEAGRGRKEADYTVALDEDGLRGARLAVMRDLVDRPGADTAVVRVFEQAVADLARLGAEIVDPFDFDLQEQAGRPGMFCNRFRYDMHVYLESLGEGAPIRDVREVLETGQYSEYIEGRLRGYVDTPLDVHPANRDPPCLDYLQNEGRQAYLSALVGAMDAARVDAVIYPTWLNPPAHIDRGGEEYRGDNSQGVVPATGVPAITVPMGFTYGRLPAGLQILARPYDELLLFRLAYAYEQGTHHRVPPNPALGLGPGSAPPASHVAALVTNAGLQPFFRGDYPREAI
jgi:Asp-tRNA(Asn)/Glu-tRNA(Gln) amidotransferase A subunit family amidase